MHTDFGCSGSRRGRAPGGDVATPTDTETGEPPSAPAPRCRRHAASQRRCWSPAERALVGRLAACETRLSRRRLVAGGIIGTATCGAGLWYLGWRLSTLTGTGVIGAAFLGAEAVNLLQLIVTFALLLRIRWDPRELLPPTGTLDVYVTVCGEPVEMVERTLHAAVAIDYPHRTFLLNDGAIADRDGWQEMEALAARLGVPCFTRLDGTRGKAGNLNHALHRTDAELICVIDADHVAAPNLGDEVVGYFQQEDVGFVVTPQRFDLHGDPLNNHEPMFHGAVQLAKDVDGSAFSCGNGVVYRRSALEGIGGFSEWNIVEDLHTSYALHAAGWRSVYHSRPVTLGQAPTTAAGVAAQRLTWATDSLRLLFYDSPLRRSGLSFVQRLHYLSTTGHYLVTLTQLGFLVSPFAYVFFGVAVLRPSSLEAYLLHGVPYFALLFGFVLVYSGGPARALRTIQSSSFLAPVYLLAAVRALTGRRFFSGITEKSRPRRVSALVLPQAVLLAGLLAVVVVAVVDRTGGRAVTGFWAGLMALLLLGPMTALTRREELARWLRRSARVGLVGAAAGAVVLSPGPVAAPPSAGDWQVQLADVQVLPEPRLRVAEARHALADERTPPPPPQAPTLLASDAGLYAGFYNAELQDAADGVQHWADRHGLTPRIVHVYQHWGGSSPDFDGARLARIVAQGAVPMVTWEPWTKPSGSVHGPDQPRFALARISAGDFDPYIHRWARAAAAFEAPILVRPMHEMNGTWYPWGVHVNGNSPGDYVDAWRHIVDIFEAEDAGNVSWVWSVNAFSGDGVVDKAIEEYHPGDAYVDWAGVSVFNWGTSTSWGAWRGVERILGETYEALGRFDEPIMIAELGTVGQGGDPALWLRDLLDRLPTAFPDVRAVLFFDADYPGAPDFRIDAAAAEVLRGEAAASDRYQAPPQVGRRAPRVGSRLTAPAR